MPCACIPCWQQLPVTPVITGHPPPPAPLLTPAALLAFSLASPLAALATYVLLTSAPALSSDAGIALAVLFSGGTFLFAAAVHVLPSVSGSSQPLTRPQLAAAAAGMLLPLLLSAAIPHDHHHH